MFRKSIDDFLIYLRVEKRYSPNTVVSYRNDLLSFQQFLIIAFGEMQVEEIKHGIVRSWIVNLMNRNLTAKSINRKISTLKSFFNYLKRMQSIDINPMRKIVAPKIGKRLPQFIQEKQIKRLFEDDYKDLDFPDLRNIMILELFYLTGMRRIELIQLDDKSLNIAKREIKVLGKGNKERIIPLDANFIDKLSYYKQIRNEHFENEMFPALFVTDKGKAIYPKLVYNIVKKALDRVSTSEKKSPHILRHSFATHLTNNGADLNAVKELLGHASLAATQVYTHNSIEKLKEIYAKAHPKG